MPNPSYHVWLWALTPAPDRRSVFVFGGRGAARHPGGLHQVALDGARLRSFEGHDGMVAGIAFHPDGRRMLSAGGGTARLWDWTTG